MIYDVPFRHQQALDPSALTTVTATLYAINKALEDCRNAGVNPDSDPAVALLTRHIGTVSSNTAETPVLRAACNRRIEDLKRFPTLLTLAIRGVAYDVAAKNQFHQDGREAMRMLASALGLTPETYTIRNVESTADQSGHVMLAAADLAVMLQIGGRHEGREVSYRAVSQGHARPNQFAPIKELLKPGQFAERLSRELGLTRSAAQADLLAPLAA